MIKIKLDQPKKQKRPSKNIQEKAIQHVNETFDFYKTLLSQYRQMFYKCFKATYVFEFDRQKQGGSTLFFPKCFSEVEKVVPRLTYNSPKFIIDLNVNSNPDDAMANMEANKIGIQAYINWIWKMGQCNQKLRSITKTGVICGIGWGKASFEQKHRTKTVQIANEQTGEFEEYELEEILTEYPTFEDCDVLDMYFDPRLESVDSMSAVIENVDQVKLVDLYANKKQFFNLKKLSEEMVPEYATDDGQKQARYSVEGIAMTNKYFPDNSKLNYKNYYGYFSETGKAEDAKMKLMTVVNGSVLIRYEDIDFIPFEMFRPIEIPKQAVGCGVVEPILDIQNAYNLTRNQRFENISLILNRMWKVKRGANINRKELHSRAGGVVTVGSSDDIEPLQMPDVTGSSFNETQSLNTEVQQANGTIDTTQDASSNGFTNLATGQKIRYSEMNLRINSMRVNLEEFLSRLGQKMMMVAARKMTVDPRFQDEVTQQFYQFYKNAFDGFEDYYSVSVLTGSTMFDSIENKRDEVLAKGQLCINYHNLGLPIDLKKSFVDSMDSFPGTDGKSYLMPDQQPQEQNPPTNENISEAELSQIKGKPDFQTELNNRLSQV